MPLIGLKRFGYTTCNITVSDLIGTAPLVVISSANSVRLSILRIICYRQRESIVTCEIVVIPMNSVLTCIKVFYYSIIVLVHLIFLTFVSCLLTVTLHLVDVRLTCLINITYLLTYLHTYLLRLIYDEIFVTACKAVVIDWL